jgi:hypothetical protein
MAAEAYFKPGFRMMRYETSQTVIPKLANEPRSVKLMQPRLLQARRVPDIVNITSGDQHVTIMTVLSEQPFRNTLRLDADTGNMMPAPRL